MVNSNDSKHEDTDATLDGTSKEDKDKTEDDDRSDDDDNNDVEQTGVKQADHDPGKVPAEQMKGTR